MPRTLKPLDVETFEHKGSKPLQIRLNRNTKPMQFEAYVAGQKYADETIEGLKAKLRPAIEAHLTLAWQGLISVQKPYTGDNDDAISMSLRIERYWIARRPNGTYLKLDWDGDKNNLKDGDAHDGRFYFNPHGLEHGQEFTLPWNPQGFRYRYHGTMYLAYDEQTWAALDALKTALIKPKGRLDELLKDEAGIAELVDMHSGLALLEAAAGGNLGAIVQVGDALARWVGEGEEESE